MHRAAIVAPILLAATACGSSDGPADNCGYPSLPNPLVALERGDQTAALARLAGGCLTETGPDPVLGTDANLLDTIGQAYVGVNDDGTLRAIDLTTLHITQTLSAYPDHPPAPSQPPHGLYGVAMDPGNGNLWVSRDDVPEVAVLSTGGGLVGTVDLGVLDPEGHGDMNGILILDNRAFVALGFLTHGDGGAGAIASDTARRPGMIAVVDVSSHEIVGKVTLFGHNPVKKLITIDTTGKRFIVATPGRHDSVDADDGIDLVDLVAGTATQLISETTLGGSVDEVVWAGPTEAYAITLGPMKGVNPTKVVRFDPQTKQVTATLTEAPFFTDSQAQGFVHAGLAIDGDYVVVGDHDQANPSILLFPRAGGAPVTIPVSVEAPWGFFVAPK